MKKKTPLIAPSLLSADLSHLALEVQAVEKAGADWLHLDIMDGHFVPNLTMGPDIVASVKKITDLPLDVHLMIENPEKHITAFAKAGANILTVHIETLQHPEPLLKQIRQLGIKTGLSLKPDTPVTQILPFLKNVDLVLIMTVHPGFSGQKFIEKPLEKIKAIRGQVGQDVLIAVDGGVNDQTKKTCIEQGADVLVAGNYIFKNDYKQSINLLRSSEPLGI